MVDLCYCCYGSMLESIAARMSGQTDISKGRWKAATWRGNILQWINLLNLLHEQGRAYLGPELKS